MNRPEAGEPPSIQKRKYIDALGGAGPGSVAAGRSMQPDPLRSFIRRTSDETDWRLTIIAAFSFLLHFGLVGSIDSDWLDPLVDEGPSIEGLVDGLKLVPVIEPAPEPVASEPMPASLAPDAKASESGAAPSPGRVVRGAAGDERARLNSEIASRELAILQALDGSGTAARSLPDGKAVTQLLDGWAADGRGVATTVGPGLRIGDGGGETIAPGAKRSLQDLGGTTASAPTGAGSGGTLRAPSGTARVEPPAVVGNVPNADRTVAGLKASYRRCYQRGLESMPDAEGSVELRVKIGANGEVTSIATQGGSRLGSEIVRCLVQRTEAAHFDPPASSSATVVIPVTFAQQK
jgi:TonB family protein